MILGMGVPELLVILVVVLLIFGPKNLPKLGKSLGQTVKNVREGMEEGDEKDKDSKKVEEPKADEAEDVVADEDDADVEDAPAEKAKEDVQFCPKCGAENAADAAFCKKCGAKLGE